VPSKAFIIQTERHRDCLTIRLNMNKKTLSYMCIHHVRLCKLNKGDNANILTSCNL